jgi:hypothetical protein
LIDTSYGTAVLGYTSEYHRARKRLTILVITNIFAKSFLTFWLEMDLIILVSIKLGDVRQGVVSGLFFLP